MQIVKTSDILKPNCLNIACIYCIGTSFKLLGNFHLVLTIISKDIKILKVIFTQIYINILSLCITTITPFTFLLRVFNFCTVKLF